MPFVVASANSHAAAQCAVLDVVGDRTRQGVEEALGHRDGRALEAAPDERRYAIDEREGLVGTGLAIDP